MFESPPPVIFRSPLLLAFFLLVLASPFPCRAQSFTPDSASEKTYTLDTLVITATRSDQTLRDIPANVSVLTRADVQQSAAQTLDELLLQVPGFSLFRRSSSLTAHPTTQGVSLRGIGASGSSRTLVLLDGVPLNDPFGGWVDWSRVPLEQVERIEVLRGGGAQIWGNYALGGVINILTRPVGEKTAGLSVSGGNRGTGSLDLTLGNTLGATGLLFEGGYFRTAGFPVLRESQRGAIDVDAASRNLHLGLKMSHPLPRRGELQLRLGFFDEERDNGTPLTNNATRTGSFAFGAVFHGSEGGKLTLRSFTTLQKFNSFYSSQESDRSAEFPALDQYEVPSREVGATVEWIRPAGRAHTITAGTDFRFSSGETREYYLLSGGQLSRRRMAGGDQALAGVYFQDTYAFHPRAQLTLGARLDYWRSYDGSRRESDRFSGDILRKDEFRTRGSGVFDPQAALLIRVSQRVSMRSSLYRTFRAPTNNELYRPFRVRNDITEADPKLRPEHLLGAEAGIDYRSIVLTAGLTGYWNRVEDAIFNFTVGEGPGQVPPCGFVPGGGTCRQRRNLGRTRIRGLEAALEYRPLRSWSLGMSYLLSHARVARTPLDVSLEGKRIPQVPEHNLVLSLSRNGPGMTGISLQARFQSRQYEDDFNSLPLAGFGVLDLAVERPLGRGAAMFLRLENLFNRSIETGRTVDGLVSTGTPRMAALGLRAQL